MKMLLVNYQPRASGKLEAKLSASVRGEGGCCGCEGEVIIGLLNAEATLGQQVLPSAGTPEGESRKLCPSCQRRF